MLSEGSSCTHLVVVSNQVGLYALQFGSTSAVKGKSNKSTCFEHAVLWYVSYKTFRKYLRMKMRLEKPSMPNEELNTEALCGKYNRSKWSLNGNIYYEVLW